jgi:endonuclease/exonuclease/phosphatase family metal-dependent hydrolase
MLDPAYWALSSEFSDGWVASGGNIYTGRTWNDEIPLLRVDYIWLTNHWSVLENSGRHYETEESDHLGFSLEIVIQ